MTIDMPKTTEPKIPDLLPGVPRDAEVQGDPGCGEGGGGGRSTDGTRRGSTRSMWERRRRGTRRGSRSRWERSMDGSRRGSRSRWERSMDGARRGSRSNAERSRRMARRDTEEPTVWRRSRDGIWRRSSEPDQSNASQISTGQGVVSRLLEQCDAGQTFNTTTVSFPDPNNFHQRLYFPIKEAETRGKILINFDFLLIIYTIDEFFSLDPVDEKRFETASKVVQEINSLSRQRPGDCFTSINVPSDLAGSQCYLCVLGNECLGLSCLGYSGKVKNRFVLEYQFIENCRHQDIN